MAVVRRKLCHYCCIGWDKPEPRDGPEWSTASGWMEKAAAMFVAIEKHDSVALEQMRYKWADCTEVMTGIVERQRKADLPQNF